MSNDDAKRAAAQAALEHIEPLLAPDSIVGVGTGSTANFFIDALAKVRHKFDAAVSSSETTSARLKTAGVQVLDLNSVKSVLVYVDGADEVDPRLNLIKGAGGALTREKIVAAASERFVCIVDESKCVDILGRFPLPIEVIPMARGLVGRALVDMGGDPELRDGYKTDNGNLILDVRGFTIVDPGAMESRLNDIVGVVCNGIFAHRKADELIVGRPAGARLVRAR